MNKNKLYVIINTFFIFALGFVTHNLYNWFPNFLTILFPVNESLYEHVKMIFLTPFITGTVLYLIFYFKGHKINNFIGSTFVSSLLNIIVFYVVFLPIYNQIGENIVVTLIVYFISIVISQIVNYYLINRENNKVFNIVSLILTFITIIILLYYTYNPIRNDFFLDTSNNTYGIPDR